MCVCICVCVFNKVLWKFFVPTVNKIPPLNSKFIKIITNRFK